MDPYFTEGELMTIHNSFHQSQYNHVLQHDTSSLSNTNTLPARILKLRAQCANNSYNNVISSVSPSEASSSPDLAAIRLLASYCQASSTSSPTDKILSEASTLATSHADNVNVQICIGTLLAKAGEYESALTLMKQHQGSLDVVALIVQTYLLMNRTDLASKECKSARGFAQDALLVNLSEAWVGMREGGEKYQQAYYVFEELAQASSTQSVNTLIAQAVSEIHLGRLPEAETALGQALGLDGESADALANTAVLNTILGKKDEVESAVTKLSAVAPGHVFLQETQRRKEAFDSASQKYTPKFEP